MWHNRRYRNAIANANDADRHPRLPSQADGQLLAPVTGGEELAGIGVCDRDDANDLEQAHGVQMVAQLLSVASGCVCAAADCFERPGQHQPLGLIQLLSRHQAHYCVDTVCGDFFGYYQVVTSSRQIVQAKAVATTAKIQVTVWRGSAAE